MMNQPAKWWTSASDSTPPDSSRADLLNRSNNIMKLIVQEYASTNGGNAPADNLIVEWGQKLTESNVISHRWQLNLDRSPKKRKATADCIDTCSSYVAEKRPMSSHGVVAKLIKEYWIQNEEPPPHSEVEGWRTFFTEAKVISFKHKKAKTRAELPFETLAPTAGQCAEVPLLVEDGTKTPTKEGADEAGEDGPSCVEEMDEQLEIDGSDVKATAISATASPTSNCGSGDATETENSSAEPTGEEEANHDNSS